MNNPFQNIHFSALPTYSIVNVPILSYILIAVTSFTLGYVTMKESDTEEELNTYNYPNEENNESTEVIEEAREISNEKIEKGGSKHKSNKTKKQQNKRKKQKKN